MKIHVWVPEYEAGSGGIQTFSRLLVRALGEIFPQAQMSVFSKNDPSFPKPTDRIRIAKFKPFGWWEGATRTPAFSASLLWNAVTDKPDLIVTTHCNFSPVARLLQVISSTPWVAIGHGIEVWEIGSHSMRSALRTADRLLAVSQFTRVKMASALAISPDQIGVLPNTFAADRFAPAPKPHFLLKRYGLRPEQPIILTVARLDRAERYKGYDQVLRALPEIAKAFPNIRYVIGGRGPDRARVRALMEELGVKEEVILAGYIPEHELNAHYNLCDVFAMPSKGEGFGIVFLEALACGKPVIAGNQDGSIDAVLNGELGVLVDPDDVKKLAETIIQIIARRHPLKILQQPEELRRQVIKTYGYEKFKDRLRSIVEPLLK